MVRERKSAGPPGFASHVENVGADPVAVAEHLARQHFVAAAPMARRGQVDNDRIAYRRRHLTSAIEYAAVICRPWPRRSHSCARQDAPREVFPTATGSAAYIFSDVRRETRRPPDFPLPHPSQFMQSCFAQEVPESMTASSRSRRWPRSPDRRAKIGVDFPGFIGRSGRRLCRHARLARAGRGQ